MSTSSDAQSFGLVLGSLLSQKFPQLAMIAPLLGIKIMSYLENSDLSELITAIPWMLISVIGVIATIGYYTYIWWSKKPTKEKDISSLSIYWKNDVHSIIEYIKKYPQFFSDFPNIDIGEITADGQEDDEFGNGKTLSVGQKISINDKNFNTVGYIDISEHDKKDPKTDTIIKIKYPKISIEKTCGISAEEYFEKIKKRNTDDKKTDNTITLACYKIMRNQKKEIAWLVTDMYSGDKDKLKPDTYMLDFFHPEKEILLAKIMHAQSGASQFSAIFHGPPGTGKSTLVYRMAMLTRRQIISVDLTALKYKSTIFAYFNSITNNGIKYTYKNSIVLLEEFDIVFEYLKKQAEIDNRMKNRWVDKKVDDHVDSKKKNEDTFVGQPEEFTLRDLLEILQGPVPMNGRMVVATTNKLPEPIKACPELFRDGRLTPIKFDHLKRDQVNMMIDHHFPENPELRVGFDPDIPSSKILDHVNTAKILNDVSYFAKSMKVYEPSS